MAGGVTEAASQMYTNDNVNDMMIVITDGFDGDIVSLKEASAEAATAGITVFGVAYDETGAILVCILALKFNLRHILD